MQLIFNNPDKPNQERNFKTNYILAVLTFAAAATIGFYFNWVLIVIPLLALGYQFTSIYQTLVEIDDAELSIIKKHLFFNRTINIPLYKLRSWRLMSKAENKIELHYILKNGYSKKVLLSHHRNSDKNLIHELKKYLKENEMIKLNSGQSAKDS
jgi:hypothetical protein